MRKFFPVLGLLIGCFAGCTKDDTAPGFDMIYQQEFAVPPGVGPFVTHHFYLKNISTRYLALLDQHGRTDAEIKSILPVQGALVGIFGDADFSVVEEASLRIYQESDPNGYIEVAYRFPTPIDRSNVLDLIPSLADAKKIMTKDRFSIDLALRLRNTTPDEMLVRLNLQLKATY
ncbi:MAG: hypothetical protein IPM98_13915 [Lewinellaceae bacterium]|nr:hypothetical protein [Lewinellaceae bacterium]